ncbi:MAG: sugar-binding domain-containing protein, partial [Prolixibacteraceae bacterium]
MIKKFLFSIPFLALTLIAFPRTGKQFTETHAISLAGNWRVALDVFNTGTTAKWFENGLPREENIKLQHEIYFKGNDYGHPETIFLPGTENDGRLGKKLSNSPGFAGGLERLYAYDGILWVEREVMIPENWNNKPVQLFLERVPGSSKVWWDGILKGESEDFATPHICEITSSAVPGKHRLTIMVNNSPALQTWSHHATNGSGARWNGIIGKIELQASERIHIKDIQVYPDIQTKKAIVKITVRNMDQIASKGTLVLAGKRKGFPDQPGSRQNIVFQMGADTCSFVTAKISVPEPVVLWDEFNPALYELKVTLKVEENVCDSMETYFGMREWSVRSSQFLLNGQPVFLRGTLDCGQFPLKADPAMDKESWLHVLGVYKEYGLNHVRFHTWCPPEAAFQAADELGMLIQVELTGSPYSEMSAILDTYGNHPSFGMVSLQNEKSHTDITRQVITKAKEHDPRHLYCCTSHPWDPDCIDDFFVSALGAEKRRTVGIQWSGFDVLSVTRFNTHEPETASDYRDAIKGINAPMLSHEMGQWAVYPDLSEIDQYVGVLRNTNYEKIKE